MNPSTQNRRPKTLEKSFAISHRAQYWHPTKNGNLQPRDIALNHSKKIWFLCADCSHEFETTPHGITGRNRWCSFCTNQQLCSDLNCSKCLSKSFASSNKAEYWVYDMNNNITPRDVFVSSKSRHWFKCNNCVHVFDAVLNDVAGGNWCPYCANKRSCGNDCIICLNQVHIS